MENEKIDLKDRLLAGLAYLIGLLFIVIWFFYRKDRKGFVYYHCIQAMSTQIVLFVLFFLLGLLGSSNPVLDNILFSKYGPFEFYRWLFLVIVAILSVPAFSGKRFRIPLACNITDWCLNYLDVLAAKAEEAKKKKV